MLSKLSFHKLGQFHTLIIKLFSGLVQLPCFEFFITCYFFFLFFGRVGRGGGGLKKQWVFAKFKHGPNGGEIKTTGIETKINEDNLNEKFSEG